MVLIKPLLIAICMPVVLSLRIEKTPASITAARVFASPAILISSSGEGLGKPGARSCTIAVDAFLVLMEVAEAVPWGEDRRTVDGWCRRGTTLVGGRREFDNGEAADVIGGSQVIVPPSEVFRISFRGRHVISVCRNDKVPSRVVVGVTRESFPWARRRYQRS